jgi:hypothetical protein
MDEEEDVPFESAPLIEPAKGEVNLEDAFQNLFSTSASGTGEEELLRIASTFSMQLSATQIKVLLYLEWAAASQPDARQKQITNFVARYLELKQHNNSDAFVMRALESISLRKFIGENAFKVDISK